MKNDEPEQPFASIQQDFLTSPVKCALNQPSEYACLNQNCQKYAFLCHDKTCHCRTHHPTCLVVELATLTAGLMGKVVPVHDLQTLILEAVDRLTDLLSDFRQKTIATFQNKFNFFGLNYHEQSFMRKLQTGDVSQISGKHLWEAHLNFTPEPHIIAFKDNTINSLQKIFASMENKIQSYCAELTKQVDLLEQQSTRLGQKQTQLPIKNPQINSNLSLKFACSASKVVTKFQEFCVLQSFFAPKIIKKVKLLYQASNEKFEVGKFHEKCDNATDTLTLCETEFGKKFGGYTPLAWGSPSSYVYKVDEKEESFIFSLSHGDKFTLVKKANSIRQDVLYGPTFGSGQDFIIRNKANEASDSTANINTSYFNSNYKNNDKGSWERFCGNPHSSSFKLREWEVWKLEFE